MSSPLNWSWLSPLLRACKARRQPQPSRSRRVEGRGCRPRLEPLEDRLAPAILTPGSPTIITAQEGAATGSETFTFTDSTRTAVPAELSASIDWGDGSGTDTSTSIAASNGVITVTSAGHSYAEEGSYTVKVTLTDVLPFPATVTSSNPATVADPQITNLTVTPPSVTENQSSPNNFVLATFTDPDGAEGVQTLTKPGLTHWFQGEGNDDRAGGSIGTINGGVTFAAGQVGQAFSFPGSGNANVAYPAADFAPGTADFTVAFGLQTTVATKQAILGDRVTSGIGNFFGVRMNNGKLDVELDEDNNFVGLGSSLAINDGAFHYIVVTRSGSTVQVYIDGTLDSTASSAGPTDLTGGNPFLLGAEDPASFPSFTGLLDEVQIYGRALSPAEAANSSAAFLRGILANYTASINWGDGSAPVSGMVVPDSAGNGKYDVEAPAHAIGDEGVQNVTVTVGHDALPTVSATAVLTVPDPAVTATAGPQFNAVEGGSTNFVVLASFTDPGGPEPLSEYDATVNWADSSTPDNTTDAAPNILIVQAGGHYLVEGTHVYTEQSPMGGWTVTTTIHHHSEPGPDVGTMVNTQKAIVADPSINATGNFTVNATEGETSTTQTVATFTDPAGAELSGGNPAPGEYTATINWGDSTPTTTGTITFADGTFTVRDSHQYAEEGSYTVSVRISHRSAPDNTVTSTAVVSAQAMPPAQITIVSGNGQSTGVAMTFSSPLMVLVLDSTGDPVSGATVTFAAPNSSVASGTFAGNLRSVLVNTDANGIATAPGFTADRTAGSYQVTASTGTALASFTLTNTPGAASKLAVVNAAGTITAGQTFGLQVAVEDSFGNVVTSDGSTVNLSGATFASGSTSANAVNGLATFSNLSIQRATGYTLSFADGRLAGASAALTVNPSAPAFLTATGGTPQSVAVGTAYLPLSAKVTDAYGNPAPGVSVIFAAPAGASFSGGGNDVETTNANGIATTSQALTAGTTPGTFTLTATAGPLSAGYSLSSVPGQPSQLIFVNAPASATPGQPLDFQVDVEDSFGNVVTSDSSTVSITASGPGGFTAGHASVQEHNGVASFTDLVLSQLGAYRLSASNGSLSPAVSARFPVTFNDAFTQNSGTGLSAAWTLQDGGFTVVNQAATGSAAVNLATVNAAAPLADAVVSADVSLTVLGQEAGVLARWTGPGDQNYYEALLADTAQGFVVSLVRSVSGTRTVLASAGVASGSGPLLLDVSGSSLTLLLNGSVILSATDATLSSQGAVGVRATAGAALHNFHAAAALAFTAPPADQTFPDITPAPVRVGFSISDPDVAAPSFSATVVSAVVVAEQRYALTGSGNLSANALGFGEKWLKSANGSNAAHGGWFVVLPDGSLRAWDGTRSLDALQVLAQLGAAFYADPLAKLEQALLGDTAEPASAAGLTAHYGLTEQGSYFFNYLHAGEEWLHSDNGGNVAHAGWYLLFSDGAIRPWDGTGNATANAPVGEVNGLFWQTYPDVLVTAAVAQTASATQQSLGLSFAGSYFQSSLGLGLQEKWLKSQTNPGGAAKGGWYLLFQDGSLHPWTGSSTFGASVATLNASYWSDPRLLLEAKAPLAAPVGVAATLSAQDVSGATVNLGGFTGFQGSYGVELKISDAATDATTAFLVTTTATPLTLSSPGPQTANISASPQAQVTLSASDPDRPNATLTYQVANGVFSTALEAQAAALTQALGLTFTGTYYQNFLGSNEKWLHSSNGSNAGHGGWFLLLPDGSLRPWNGAGNALALPAVATFSASYWSDPTTLLHPKTLAGISARVSGNQVSYDGFTAAQVGQTLYGAALVNDGLATAWTTYSLLVQS
jgi:hypothetical protein